MVVLFGSQFAERKYVNSDEVMMGRETKIERMDLAFFLAVCVGFHAMAQGAPPGAAALGYTLCVINEKPTAADIAPGSNGDYKWFNGQW